MEVLKRLAGAERGVGPVAPGTVNGGIHSIGKNQVRGCCIVSVDAFRVEKD